MSIDHDLGLDLDVDPDDFSTNPSDGPTFTEVVERRSSRRTVLAGGMAGAAAFLTTSATSAAPAAAKGAGRVKTAELLGFRPIRLGYGDRVARAVRRRDRNAPGGVPRVDRGPT